MEIDKNTGYTLTVSSRARSGYKWIIYDGRSSARLKPWSIHHPKFRSRGFVTAYQAAVELARFRKGISRAKPKTKNCVSSTLPTSIVVPSKQRRSGGYACGKCGAKPKFGHICPFKNIDADVATPSLDPLDPVLQQSTAEVAGSAKPDDWMNKQGLRFNRDQCDLFGRRITIARKANGMEELAVIKSYQPSGTDPFGIVFDSKPDFVYQMNLFRKACPSWRVVDWEDDIWQTQALRPMCPRCGHPLAEGTAAWTRCLPCGEMEPGVNSVTVMPRARVQDPYRRARPSYAK